MQRFSRDDSAMMTAFNWAFRSPCCFFKVGCCITSDRVISVGYNGGPSGTPNCIDVGCKKQSGRSCTAVHAEDNAITFAGDPERLAGTTLYVTVQPCVPCSSKIIGRKIARVVAATQYSRISVGGDNRQDESQQAMEWLMESGVQFDWYQPDHDFAKFLFDAYISHIEQTLSQFQVPEL